MLALLLTGSAARGDGLIHGFEGDVLPGEAGSEWDIADACEPDCSRRLDNGCFLLEWGETGDIVTYYHWIARPPDTPPPSLWVEWRFRSNQPKPATSSSCDASLTILYMHFHDLANMFQDAVVDHSWSHFVLGLDHDVFHTFRLESVDGTNYTMSVDGFVFKVWQGQRTPTVHGIQFGGDGRCSVAPQRPVPVRNEWDYIRYGTLGDVERVVSADPPAGFLDPVALAGLDRFTVTYDAANYVYIDEITVETTGTQTPIVLATRRRDNGAPDTVEIVLDRPLPPGEHTRFIFDDGTIQSIIDYSYIPGDADGNGAVDLLESAGFQNCFGCSASTDNCLAFDQNQDGVIDHADVPPFSTSLNGPREWAHRRFAFSGGCVAFPHRDP